MDNHGEVPIDFGRPARLSAWDDAFEIMLGREKQWEQNLKRMRESRDHYQRLYSENAGKNPTKQMIAEYEDFYTKNQRYPNIAEFIQIAERIKEQNQ